MEYGNKSIKSEKLYLFQGFDPATENLPPNQFNAKANMGVVNQRDADILSLWEMVSLCNVQFSHRSWWNPSYGTWIFHYVCCSITGWMMVQKRRHNCWSRLRARCCTGSILMVAWRLSALSYSAQQSLLLSLNQEEEVVCPLWMIGTVWNQWFVFLIVFYYVCVVQAG